MSADLPFNFETLSAYVDDELDGGTRKRVEAALSRDASLVEQVDAIRALKNDIAAMRGDREQAVPATKRTRNTGLGAAIAATVAVIVFSTLLGYSWLDTSRLNETELAAQIVAVHDGFAGSSVLEQVTATLAGEVEVFNQAGLRLIVDSTSTLGQMNLRHRGYVGPNGCRVSVFSLPAHATAVADELFASANLLAEEWVANSTLTIVVARSMDPMRFEAITASLQRIFNPEFAPIIASIDIPRTSCAA